MEKFAGKLSAERITKFSSWSIFVRLILAKIIVEKGHIVTNHMMQTAESGIFAIGDVAGAPWLAHKASHEGISTAEFIAGKNPHAITKTHIPGCTYSNPQIASLIHQNNLNLS